MTEVLDCWVVCYENEERKHVIVKAYKDELVAEEEAYMWTVETDVQHYVKKGKATKRTS